MSTTHIKLCCGTRLRNGKSERRHGGGRFFLCCHLYCYYHRPLRRTLQGSVRCSAFAKCLILIPLHENIYKDYGFFEAGTEMLPIAIGTPHNNPIFYIFFVGLEHSGQPGMKLERRHGREDNNHQLLEKLRGICYFQLINLL
jgi:hypothetical protein